MSQPYTGEIRIFAGTYAPLHWTFCHGQILPISGNDALFSLLGTMYGGDGRSTFGIPDLRGRLPVGDGTGPGLTPRPQGQKFGVEEVTLTPEEIPAHQHELQVSSSTATSVNPDSGKTLATVTPADLYAEYDAGTMHSRLFPFPTEYLENAGGDDAHSNMMPALGLNFIICMQGVYPPRN
ncbi:MAG TPA: phage tail protein [Desulfobacteraceae bacterium]|nr:phage tail protein [Desulfobacteraceae bacterium]|tara:strand:- start:236 stop:775 length:540 start_codon:yes stop_codon:yes gene_type:complete